MSDTDDDKLVISKLLLKELELQLLEDRKRIDRHLRVIALLRCGMRETPVVSPLVSPTGRKSRCVELSKQSSKVEFRTCKPHVLGFTHHPSVQGEPVEIEGATHGRCKSDSAGADPAGGITSLSLSKDGAEL
jgi:hypothetical protein